MFANVLEYETMISPSYLEPAHDKIRILPLLTVPEAAPNGYRFAGVPDGIGAFAAEPGFFDVLITHELRYNYGGTRLHAGSGAFVSRWRIDARDWCGGAGCLRVVSGEDLIRTIYFWEHAAGDYRKGDLVPIERLCSADLPAPSALGYIDETGALWGTEARLFLGGEETHTKYKPEFGRAFAHIASGPDTGTSFELPRLGRASWENVLASPFAQRKTVVMLPDDATTNTSRDLDLRNPTSELYVYVGEKTANGGADHQRAGLTNGTLFGLQVYIDNDVVLAEDHDLGFGGGHSGGAFVGEARFRLVDLGDRSTHKLTKNGLVKYNPGTALQKDSLDEGVTQFLRLEDGCWDPRPEGAGHFWIVTTGDVDDAANAAVNSRLFHIVFDDIEAPDRGGTIRIVASGYADGKWRFRLLDSVTVDRLGRVFVQEDPDKSNALSRTLCFAKDGTIRLVARAAPRFFRVGGAEFITRNEESAGIVPVDDLLGEGWFLTAVQCNDLGAWTEAMRPVGMTDEDWGRLKRDLVTPGQLLAIHIPPDIENELPEI